MSANGSKDVFRLRLAEGEAEAARTGLPILPSQSPSRSHCSTKLELVTLAVAAEPVTALAMLGEVGDAGTSGAAVTAGAIDGS